MTPTPGLTGQRILVVEDEWLIAQHLSMLLEQLECKVVGPVANVVDALAKVAEGDIDCALIDANLNGTSSAAIVDALTTACLPFIIVTGYCGLELPTEAMNAAPRLKKPFADYELRKTLLGVIEPQL